MKFTEYDLRQVYRLLHGMYPFTKMKGLLAPTSIEFKVSQSKSVIGSVIQGDGWLQIIEISEGEVGTLEYLIQVMAHEMIHVHCNDLKIKSEHGQDFRKWAKLICKEFHWSEKEF